MRGLVAALAAFALAVVGPSAWLLAEGWRALGHEEERTRESLVSKARAEEMRLARTLEDEFARRMALEDARPDEDYAAQSLRAAEGASGVVLVRSPLAGGDHPSWLGPYVRIDSAGAAGPADPSGIPSPALEVLAAIRGAAVEDWLGQGAQTAWSNELPEQASGQQQIFQAQRNARQERIVLPGRVLRVESRPRALLEAQLEYRGRPADVFADPGRVADLARALAPGKGKGGGPETVEVAVYPLRLERLGGLRLAWRLVRLSDREVVLQAFAVDLEEFLSSAAPALASVAREGSGTVVTLGEETWRLAVPPEDLESKLADARGRRTRFLALAVGQVLVLLAGLFALGWLVRGRIELARRRTEFVASVSHELRTPLAGIRMHADLLPDRLAGDPVRAAESLAFLRQESERMTRLVENVLGAARIESRRFQYRFEIGDVGEVAREVAETWQDLVHQAGGELDVRLDSGRPLVRFDREAVRRILVNLVENAVKFHDGPPAIELAVRSRGDAVVLEVADRGIGLGGAPARTLFEKFVRGDDDRARRRTGAGLGLFLVQQHAAEHGARTEAEDRPGGGAVFRVVFPAVAG